MLLSLRYRWLNAAGYAVRSMPSLRGACVTGLVLAGLGACGEATAQAAPESNAAQGKTFFQQNCAMCHADSLGAGNLAIQRQGPSLVGVFGRRAGSQPNFNFTNALSGSGITWDSASLDRFLANPVANVPGTAMPVSVAAASDRSNVIAYLATLKLPPGVVRQPAGILCCA